MSKTHSNREQQWVEVMISDRRLPARMVANRVRTDLRHPGVMMRPRLGRSRTATALMATVAMLIGLARLRQTS